MNGFHRWLCRSFLWRRELDKQILPWALADADLGPNVLEIGPGPGLVTDVLRTRVPQITSVEIDPALARSLGQRMRETNVRVLEGDGTKLPFRDSLFSGAVCFTMLHHVPSPALQDRLLAEVRRVLKPGGVFVGVDSRWSRGMQLVHYRDTLVPVDPSTFPGRLKHAGFAEVTVEPRPRMFRFTARRP